MKLAEKLLEELGLSLSIRIRELTDLINKAENWEDVVLARENLMQLMINEPDNMQIKGLISKANNKIKKLKMEIKK